MVQWLVRSIPHCGPTEIFSCSGQCSATGVTKAIGYVLTGARCSSVVRAFAHGAMGRWIDLSWGGPIELFLVPAVVCVILSVG